MAIQFLNTVAVDTNVLYVDTSSDRVGIGTTSPSQKLEVNGNVTANRYYGTGSTTYYVDPNDTSQAAYFAGDIRITDSGTATIKLDSTSMLPGASILATKNGSTSPPMGEISWVENISFQGSTWAQRLTNSPYTESSIKLPTSSSYNFAIKTLGSDRMVINSSGNVGIGTTSPVAKLDVNGGIRLGQYNAIQWGSNTSNQLSIQNLLSGSIITQLGSGDLELNSASNGIVFKAGGATKAKLLSSGNFGIGTTSPSRALEINTTGSNNYQFRIGTGTYYYDIGRSTSNGFLNFYGNQSNASGFVFETVDGERMRIDSSGNVGIGTTSPGQKLDVVGNIRSQFNSGDYSQLESNGSGGVIKALSSGSTTVLFRSYGDSYILNDLGIGTTNPASKLQVNGAVQVANDTATASVNKVGALRYRTSGNNSYVDMCMQTGLSTYAWVNIVTNSW